MITTRKGIEGNYPLLANYLVRKVLGNNFLSYRRRTVGHKQQMDTVSNLQLGDREAFDILVNTYREQAQV